MFLFYNNNGNDFNFNFIVRLKVCEFGGDDCIKAPSIVDHMAHKYSERLTRRVEDVYNHLKKPCNLLDLPAVPTRPPPTRKKIVRFKNQITSQSNSDTDNKNTIASQV